MHPTLLLLLFILHDTGAVDHIDNPEEPVTWTPPKNEENFKEFSVGANYSGLLYAGAAEFNWIVDLRVQDVDQEYWAVGNLISFLHVLTTAEAVDLLQLQSGGDQVDKLRDTDFPRWSFDVYRSRLTLLRINYCENYLWADGGFEYSDYNRKATGSRSAKEIVRHPDFKRNTLQNDIAIIVMSRAIPAIEPRIGYMPTGFDYVNETLKEMVTLNPDEPITHTSPLCYVASYGRNYMNHKEFYVLDYKVKYRVYITKWKDCSDVWDYVCNKDVDAQCGDNTVKESGRDYLMCLRVRARVGTVCNHDRGAPLVCNGQVIGLVIRGPMLRYCNNLYKIPFIVERLQHNREFFDDSVKYAVQPVPRKGEDPTPGPGTTTQSPKSSASAVIFLKILYIGIAWHFLQIHRIL